ncbi:MAG TPA: hypothetical protein VHZ09_03885 [Acidobacteriaceae bacterium]|jgi:hypothetical protein|nr:hypothetical protein [Acidobacteriaceae bacterium]
MSAILAMPCILSTAMAVADRSLPVWRPKPAGGLIFYRKQTLEVLFRYLHTTMELGRTPCILGKTVFRGRVSHRRMTTLEDLLIFVLDVEKSLRRLDRISQSVVAHIALQDYTPAQTAYLLHESERTVHRVYGAAMDRLTLLLMENGQIVAPDEGLSRGVREIQSNNATKQTSYTDETAKKVGSVIVPN